MSKFGLIPSPTNEKDLIYGSVKTVNTTHLPDKFESKPAKIKQQAGRGFCVGFSSSSYKETQEQKNHPYENIEISPIFIQHECKLRDGIPNDEGTHLSVAMDVLKDVGACEEKHMPLTLDHFPIKTPSKEAYENAKRYKIKSPAKIHTKEEIMQAIYEEGSVLAAVFVSDSFMYPEGKGVVDLPMGYWHGFHAIKIVGWDVNKTQTFEWSGRTLKGFFKFQNSWGSEWGDGGYGWLPFDFLPLKSDMGFSYFMEAWTSVDIINPSQSVKELTLWLNSTKAIADGKEFTLDQAPISDPKTNRSLIPLKFVSEIFGQQVKWVQNDARIEIGNNIKLWIGKEYAEANGKQVKLNQPPIVDSKSWRTLIPLKFVSEVLGYSVQWIESERKIIIRK